MMRVLMTGGAGLIGKATAERLIENGWDVRITDIAAGVEIPGAETVQCDILNYDDLLEQMRGCDSVIHLAALRSPNLAPGHDVFQINAAGTFNVFEAAAAVGIKRVVQASSINAIGAYYGHGEYTPRYLPIDEDHPAFTTDPYSFSKQIVEEIGDYYWRREGISSVALRFPGVYKRGAPLTEGSRQRREMIHRLLDELASQPDAQARIAEVRQRTLDYRRLRPMEFNTNAPKVNFADDPLLAIYTFERFNFWAFIDERDAAQSLEKGVTAEYEGAHALFANDDHNALGYDTSTLIRLFFPESPLKSDLPGSSALVSIERARQLIGFAPEYSIAKLGLT